jgi:uridine kinase
VTKTNFSALANGILERPCAHPVRLISVDGGAGAGKTTFAAQLSKALGNAPVIPMDDFISFDDLEEFWPRLEAQILAPLFQGKGFRYQKRDWVKDMAGRSLDEWRELPFSKIVIFEGIGAGRKALDSRLAYRIWVEAPLQTRFERGLARDGHIEGIQEIWERFLPGEKQFLDADGGKGRADLVIDGTKPYEGEDFWFLDRP